MTKPSPTIEINKAVFKTLADIFMTKKAKANYNMSFANGSFIEDKHYNYKFDKFNNLFYVTTEEGKKQDFYPYEFNTYFTIL